MTAKLVLIKVTKNTLSTLKVNREDYPAMPVFGVIEAEHPAYKRGYASEIHPRASLYVKSCSSSQRYGHLLLLCEPKAYKTALQALWGYSSWHPEEEWKEVRRQIDILDKRAKASTAFLHKVAEDLLPRLRKRKSVCC